MECVIPGSIMTIVDPNKNLKKKLDPNRTSTGYFLGFSNHCNVRIYFDPSNPNKIKRSHHCIIEDIATLTLLMKTVATPEFPLSRSQELDVDKSIVKSTTIDVSNTSFPGKTIHSFVINMPPPPSILGLTLADDNLFNLPYIKHCQPGSPIHIDLPPGRRCNHFVIGINSESPISSSFAQQIIRDAQQKGDKTLTLDLIHREKDMSTPLSITRAMFDSLPSLLHN